MLLINSISNTKKFFQKTIDNVKSFLTKGNTTYERLPKTPPFHPLPYGRGEASDHKDIQLGYKDLDNFYSEFTHQWDSQEGKLKIKPQKKSLHKPTKQMKNLNQTPARKVMEAQNVLSAKQIKTNTQKNDKFCKMKISDSAEYQLIRQSELCSRSVRERRLSSVVEKLKELELMDKGNVDHKLDVDEILHYYSRLTCPAFLDIVDKFFTEICSEFYCSQQISAQVK